MPVLPELRIKLNEDEKDVKDVSITLKDGRSITVEPNRVHILVREEKDIFNINISNNNLYSLQQFIFHFERLREYIKISKRLNINMSYNFFDNKTFENIIDYLEQYREKIYVLDITHNNINPRGFRKLISFLGSCEKFYDLKSDQNFMTTELFNEIIKESYFRPEIRKKLTYKQSL